MARARLDSDSAAGDGEARLERAQRFFDGRRLEAGKQRRDDADPQRPERRHRQRRSRRVGQCLFENGAWNSKGDDLYRRGHFAGEDLLERRERRDGDAFVDRVDAVDLRRIDDQHAAAFGDEIAAPRKCAVDAKICAHEAARDGERRIVLGDVASLDPRDDDLGDARRIERGDVTGVEALALFHAEPGLADRMSRYGAFGLADRNGTEFHAARPGFAAPSRRCSE